MTDYNGLKQFYNGKKVLLTGHTGFKGSWMSVMLSLLGAEVYGYSLIPPSQPSLFEIVFGKGAGEKSRKELLMNLSGEYGDVPEKPHLNSSHIGDIRDYAQLKQFYDETEPDIVIHMAAQPIVRESYARPRETYEINVLGTVNLLECVRFNPVAASVLNVTTDKVYMNGENPDRRFAEYDPLDGADPYSNSKSCSEIISHCYKNSYFDALDVSISTARAGNVIGGGDFAKDRIIPDCVRALERRENIILRNPGSVRPYQHVLEALRVYLEIAKMQFENREYSGWYNVGPDDAEAVTTEKLCSKFINKSGSRIKYVSMKDAGPCEAGYLRLDNSLIKKKFGWKPLWDIDRSIEAVCEWTEGYFENEKKANAIMCRQIEEYMNKC